MLYEKNKKPISEELFREPTAEYRGAPFWSWNDALDEKECVRQAGIFRDMGFGGYHMHPRAGLATPYLGEKFNSCVKACVEDAKRTKTLAWLYDEDRYPSGFGGGEVTKDGRFRRRGLVFTPKKRAEDATFSDGRQTGGAKLLATYAVRLALGKCSGYARLKEGEKAAGKRFYAYLVVDEPSDQFNQAGYVDALCKEALDRFADYTYGTYQKIVGDEFGKSVPAIFTDEPQTKFIAPFKTSLFPCKAVLPWTDDFAETYEKTFGEDVLDVLPELFFDMPSETLFRTRFRYHTHRVERFAEAFSDNLGKKAEELGLHLTGHLMEEPSLDSQSKAVGETMRHYKNFGLPGIDLLCGRHEYTAAKQTESVVRQEGKEGMLCELYGVSRWVAEFGKFKEEGDWLACLGVTVRVPHLSYYSMRGEAKRDYPPSLFYQSPWYLKWSALEDHFARLNVALTRGKAVNEVAVIHPIESYFMHLAANNTSRKYLKKMNADFLRLTDDLLFGGCDFDFISEALLPSQRTEDPLAVGKCEYKTILVPNLLSMRRSTLDYLKAFRKAGGKVVFLGSAPAMIDGVRSFDAVEFEKECARVPFDRESVLSAVKENLPVSVSSEKRPNEYLSTLREDEGGTWLFLTAPRAGFPYPRSVPVTNDPNVIKDRVTVGVKGNWRVTEFDTVTGEIKPLAADVKGGVTYVQKTLYNNDSLLLRLEEGGESKAEPAAEKEAEFREIALSGEFDYALDEPNVLLLDKAKWSAGKGYHARRDLDLLTNAARKSLGLGAYRSELQPWLRNPEKEKARVSLLFKVESEISVPAKFACEYEDYSLTVNGEAVTAAPDGYYVDQAILTIPIEIKAGRNAIELSIPMGRYDCCENCYLLGEFGVDLKGTKGKIVPLPKKLAFRDVTKQFLPFYGGKITYFASFEAQGEEAVLSARYASALLTANLNGEEKDIFFAPYEASLMSKKGENSLALTAYVSRENAFGAVHIRRKYKRSDSPSWFHRRSLPWRVRGYVLDKGGILEDPVIRLIEKK